MTKGKNTSTNFISNSEHSILLFIGNKKALFSILYCTFFILLVFAAKNYYLGYFILASSLVIFVILALINTFSLHKNKQLPLNISLVASILVLSLCLTIYHFGISAAYWSFPVSIVLVYVLPKRPQQLLNSLIFCFVCLYTVHFAEWYVVLRLCLSLCLTITFSNLIAAHIQQLHHEIVLESIKDPMTGALNRRQLTTHLSLSLAQNKRNGNQSAILMIDIDHFKAVNDNFGHDYGDNVIKSIVFIIKENSRESDLLFRIGGEEFLLLIQDSDITKSMSIAEKLRQTVANTQLYDNYPISISIGICLSSREQTVDTWLKQADVALYKAKRLGRNQVQQYSE